MRFCANDLFYGIFFELPFNFRFIAFKSLSEIFGSASLKPFLSDEQLTRWFIAITIFLVSKDDEQREFPFSMAVKTIVIGFAGATILVPPLLHVVEQHLVKGDSVGSLLSAFPLFRNDLPNSTVLASLCLQYVSAENSLPEYEKIISASGVGMQQRLLAVIKTLDNSLLLPIASCIIADEITRDEPRIDLVFALFDPIIAAIEQHDFRGLTVFRALNIYTAPLAEEPAFQPFVDRLLDCFMRTKQGDDDKWVFLLIRVLAEFLITNSLHIKTPKYNEFCAFLMHIF